MRDFAKISPAFWSGQTGRSLRSDPDAQVLAFYLMTAPHANMIGLYYCPIQYITTDTGLSSEGACKALSRLEDVGFCEYDAANEWVWVIAMARFQIASQLKANDKQVVGVRNELSRVPDIELKEHFVSRYRFSLLEFEAPSKPLRSPFEAPSKPLRSKEKEKEKEKETEKEKPTKPAAHGAARARHVLDTSDIPEFEKAKEIYPARDGGQNWAAAARAWRARLKEGYSSEQLLAGTSAYAEFVQRSGRTGTQFVKQAATFYGPDCHFMAHCDATMAATGFAAKTSLTGRAVL